MEIRMEETRNEMIEAAIKDIAANEYPDYEVAFRDIQKADGIRRGVTMKERNSNLAPTAYISPEDDRDVNVIARELVDLLVRSQVVANDELNFDFVTDYEQVKPKLSVRLVNKTKNPGYLDDKVYMDSDYENLVIMPVIVVSIDESNGGDIKVTKKLAENWDISTENLIADAILNAEVIEPMREMAFPVPLDSMGIDEPPFRIYTNKSSINGGSVLVYTKFREMLMNEYADGVYIIPSSKHEILLLRAMDEIGNGMEIQRVRAVIQAVNSQEVRPEDYLSDNLYAFDGDEIRSF